MIKLFAHYFRIIKTLALNSFQVSFISRFGAVLFTLGKILRFFFFGFLLVLIVTQTKTLAGYSLNQTLIFYLTFNVIDTLTQMVFRDVYRFRQHIISGDFDLILIKPMSPLFRVLLGGIDPLDLVVFIPYVLGLVYLIIKEAPSIFGIGAFFVLFFNGLIIAAAFHILVLALGILTTEIDHAIMIYRDISSVVRFPVDIYQQPIRGIVTFIIPVGIMMSFPPKALFNTLSLNFVLIAFAIGFSLFGASIFLWQNSLKKYTSASS